MTEQSTFQRKLEERRRRRATESISTSETAHAHAHDEDLIPDEVYERTDSDKELDRVVESIGILEAYVRWCGKMQPAARPGQTEGIKVSCPVPGHVDKNPSAWVNLEKQTWYCGACDTGGDAHDIAAYHFGYSVPDYKRGSDFSKLRVQMAEDFGYTIVRVPGGETEVIPPVEEGANATPAPKTASAAPLPIVTEPEPDSESDSESESDSPRKQLSVAEFIESDLDELDTITYPSLAWRELVPEDSFIHRYMVLASQDDVVEEYHFWNALLAIGFALGREVTLADFHPVYGNLFICTLGATGSGKSRARSYLDDLLFDALPHDWSDPNSKGVRKISAPGSAEVLIRNFEKPVADPTDPKKILFHAPVRGIIDFNELSALTGRSGRQGSVLKPVLMEFYDMVKEISTSSLTTGVKVAAEPFASTVTSSQPRALRDLVGAGDDASGFLNRWVFACGPDKRRNPVGGVKVRITEASPSLKEIVAWANSFRPGETIEWSPEAERIFREFFHSTLYPHQKNSKTSITARMDLLLKKLFLLFTANKKEKILSVETVQTVLSMYEYLRGSYKIPEGQIGGGGSTLLGEIGEAVEARLQATLASTGSGLTASQVTRSLKHRKYPPDQIVRVLESLVKLGIVEIQKTRPSSVGRPTVRYIYVD